MAQILVRDLEEELVARLKERARRDGRSLQSEVKVILEQATRSDMKAARLLSARLRRRFRGRRMAESTELIREDRER